MRKERKDDDNDVKFPHPYIFKPPNPPEVFGMASQVQVHAPSKEKDFEDENYCQYCGKNISKEEQLTHSCRKKPK